jgi:hypothetical protein
VVWDHDVVGSIPASPTNSWGRSSVGRAVALQASGRRFDPVRLHHFMSRSSSGKDAALSRQRHGFDSHTRRQFCAYSLTVEHPAYTRHSLQIREQSRFESWWAHQIVGRSSNGRTAGFEPADRGSNPRRPSIIIPLSSNRQDI